jgi:hypothetical protein
MSADEGRGIRVPQETVEDAVYIYACSVRCGECLVYVAPELQCKVRTMNRSSFSGRLKCTSCGKML